STSALSPSLRTWAMMARTARSTSSEASRLAARKTANAFSKSGSVVVRCRGMGSLGLRRRLAASRVSRLRRIVVGMSRHGFGAPRRPQVLHLGFDALDSQADRCPVGEVERHVAAGVFGRLGRLEGDGQQGKNDILLLRIDALQLRAQHPL